MSDRLAVFNAGRIEQVGAPAEVYERPATRFVAGFVGTSNLLTRRRRPRPILGRARDVHDPAREDPAGRSRTRRPVPDETARGRPHPERRLPRPGHALHRRASTPGRGSSSPEQNLATTSSEALAQQGKAVRLIWKRQHELPVADGVRHRWRRRTGMNTRRIVGLLAASASCSSPPVRGSGGSPAPSVPTELGSTPGPDDQRPGLAGLRRERVDRPGRRLGHATSRRRPAARSTRRSSGRPTRRTRCSRRTPSSSTSSRRRATRACASCAAASSSRSTPTCSRTTRTSSRRSRTSRTTRSTASPTASRTAAARTC